jgi:capsid protein
MGLTYDQAYSDLTGANYSSLRAGKMEFNRAVRQKQSLILYPAAVRVAEWFLDAGLLASAWKRADSSVKITFDPPDVVDPTKDGAAERADVEFGLDTFAERIQARGKDPEQHIAELKAEIELFRKTFGDEAQHPFLQTLLKLSAKAAAAADGQPEDDEDEPKPRSSA